MKALFWITFFFACLLGLTVDTAIIRGWRAQDKAKYVFGGTEEETEANGKNPSRPRTRPKTFNPTRGRCCKVGYKVAKRGLSCNVIVLDLVRKVDDMQRAKLKYHRPSAAHAGSSHYVARKAKMSAKLSNKLGKCLASFSKFFEKCCTYKEKFYSSMRKCKKRSSRQDRRRCRQSVRRRYRAPQRKRGSNKKKNNNNSKDPKSSSRGKDSA